jgi:hypothetical protein
MSKTEEMRCTSLSVSERKIERSASSLAVSKERVASMQAAAHICLCSSMSLLIDKRAIEDEPRSAAPSGPSQSDYARDTRVGASAGVFLDEQPGT